MDDRKPMEAARILDTCMDYKFRQESVCTSLIDNAVKDHPIIEFTSNNNPPYRRKWEHKSY